MKDTYSNMTLGMVSFAALGGFLFGYHTSVIAGALLFVSKEFSLSYWQEGFLVSILLIGALVGALIAGPLADRLGRLKAMVVTAYLFVIGISITAFASSEGMLLVGRGITGCAVGISSLIVPLYLSEIAPPAYRGAFVSVNQLAITIGILAAYAVNYLFSRAGEWRWMFGIGVIPALVQGVGLLFMPETPSWYFLKGREEKAISILKRIRKGHDWQNHLKEMKKGATTQRKFDGKMLRKPGIRFVLVIGILLSIFQQITGINTVIYYAPKIFQAAGYSDVPSAILASVGIGVINVLLTLLAVWLLDRAGRRKLLLISLAGMVISLGVLSIAFFISSSLIGLVAMCSLMSYVGFFAIGLGPVTWVILSEIYPLSIRGMGMSLAIFANWLSNYLISLTFLDLMAHLGKGNTFCLYALIGVVGVLFVYRYIPETKGKSLEEIEAKFIQKR